MPPHPLHEPVLDWYAAAARDLPWRRSDRTAWGVLVSEVMLQQTPVARVEPAWRAWMQRWPAPCDLAAETPGEAIRMWGRLGYPRRALRLHETAAQIVARHAGEVPEDHAALLALPGVGAYTAAAVASFAFGQRHAVVDTNVRRLLGRAVTGVARPAPALTAAESRLAESLLPDAGTDAATDAATWAVAAMELGALICTARSPSCGQCPIAHACRWRSRGAPPHAGPAPRGQRYEGTDRQARGRLLAALRQAHRPLDAAALARALPDASLRDPGQRARAVDSLVADGLVEPLSGGRLRLPGS